MTECHFFAEHGDQVKNRRSARHTTHRQPERPHHLARLFTVFLFHYLVEQTFNLFFMEIREVFKARLQFHQYWQGKTLEFFLYEVLVPAGWGMEKVLSIRM